MTLAVSKPPGLDLPDDFDPRLEKTLCFPRGLSRRQGESPSMGGTDRTGGGGWGLGTWLGHGSWGKRVVAIPLHGCAERKGVTGGLS